ncbi:hypothetical protein [Bradyrhizobium sp. CCBAU 25360]|uniref:hypothetical protein n=1 Tax=Bradyrhizobium sp. CCBAU 25360 TaxID=858425 RepID=UPI002305A535|nr:hypothetical protein [Bradyrhizobium sp. CCBAU 25360]
MKSIVGLPVKTARDLMRNLNVSRIDEEAVLQFLNDLHWRSTVDAACKTNPRIPKTLRQRCDADDRKNYCKIWRFKFKPIKLAEAERVFAALLQEGYLEPHEPEYKGDERKYQTSQKGRQLAAANLTKRFDRAKADSEVAALIARANEINTRDELVFFVHKITAFGSYLTDSNDHGDIDLVVETAPRREEHIDESHYRAQNSGKSLDFPASLTYGETEVLQLLRARKARLSFASRSTVDRMQTKTRVLFEWRPDAKRRAEMEAFDWRLHEPLRQVKEWLASTPGINVDPVEISRWCQDVAAILRNKNWQHRLFRDWSGNAAHDLMSYWGVTASAAAAEKAHRMVWDEYRERTSYYIVKYYEKPVNALIEAQIHAQFALGADYMDAAILIAKQARWKLVEDSRGWVSPLKRRVIEMEECDSESAGPTE